MSVADDLVWNRRPVAQERGLSVFVEHRCGLFQTHAVLVQPTNPQKLQQMELYSLQPRLRQRLTSIQER
jgi:hypothetical protein